MTSAATAEGGKRYDPNGQLIADFSPGLEFANEIVASAQPPMSSSPSPASSEPPTEPDLFAVRLSTLIFSDDFETGDLTRWAVTVP